MMVVEVDRFNNNDDFISLPFFFFFPSTPSISFADSPTIPLLMQLFFRPSQRSPPYLQVVRGFLFGLVAHRDPCEF